MTKVQVMSDLHLEMQRQPDLSYYIQPADILVLAGDIHVGKRNVLHALNFFAQHYKHVIYTPGNHEYYFNTGSNHFVNLNLPPNVHNLNPGTFHYNNLSFIGATLWTNFRNDDAVKELAKRYINDFRRTQITAEEMQQLNLLESTYIALEVEAVKHHGKIPIVVTHFMPRKELVHKRWSLDHTTRRLNGYFANNIRHIHPHTWIYGHTHDRSTQILDGTVYVANPEGYPGENPPYQPVILTF